MKREREATTALLVALAFGLGVLVWRGAKPDSPMALRGRENHVVALLRRDDVTEITLVRDGETLSLERAALESSESEQEPQDKPSRATWRMTSPRAERASTTAVEAWLTELESAVIFRRPVEMESAALGLDATRSRATGFLRIGESLVPFVMGAVSPQPEGSRYARVGREHAIVIAKNVVDLWLTPADTFRERALVPLAVSALRSIDVRTPAGGFALERRPNSPRGESLFHVLPSGLLASRDVVAERFSKALVALRVETFLSDDDAKKEPDASRANPALTLALTPRETRSPPLELVFSKGCQGHPEHWFARRKSPEPLNACVASDALGPFLVDEALMVETHLFSVRADEVEEVRVALAEPVSPEKELENAREKTVSAIEIARKGFGFHERGSLPRDARDGREDRDLPPAEAEAASAWLSRLVASSAQPGTVRPSAAATDAPFKVRSRVTVRSHAGEHEETVELGFSDDPARPGSAMVKRSLDGAQFVVDAAVAQLLLPRATMFR